MPSRPTLQSTKLPRSYGIQVMRPESSISRRKGDHEFRGQRHVKADGRKYVRGVYWFGRKGELALLNQPLEFPLVLKYSESQWKKATIPHTVKLFAFNDDGLPAPDFGYPRQMYELGQLTFNAKRAGVNERKSSAAGVYHNVLYTVSIEYKRNVITLRTPDGSEVDCDYKLKSSSADPSIDDPYSSDVMEADL